MEVESDAEIARALMQEEGATTQEEAVEADIAVLLNALLTSPTAKRSPRAPSSREATAAKRICIGNPFAPLENLTDEPPAPPSAAPPPAAPPPAAPPAVAPSPVVQPPAGPPPAALPPAVDRECNAAPGKRKRGRRGGVSHPRADEFFECSDHDFIEDALQPPPNASPPAASPPDAPPPAKPPSTTLPPSTASPSPSPPAAPLPVEDDAAAATAATTTSSTVADSSTAYSPYDKSVESAKESVEHGDDGYDSDASTGTVQGSRTRTAYLIGAGDDECPVRLAFGLVREDDGVFLIAPDGVSAEGVDVAVAGGTLAELAGEMVPLMDLDAAELDFEWAEPEDEPVGLPDVKLEGAADVAPMDVDATPTESFHAAQVELWRQRACEHQDEVQWARDELLQFEDELRQSQARESALLRALGEASDDALMACEGADKVRVRIELQDSHQTRLVPLQEYLQECSHKGERPPILTSTERLRKAKMTTGVYKQRAEVANGALDISTEKLVAARAELEQAKRQHALELVQIRGQHEDFCKGLRMRHTSEIALMAAELARLERALATQTKRADDAWAWKRIECRRLEGHEAQRLEWKDVAHRKELTQRSSRTSTWTTKRRNMSRTLARARAAVEAKAAELKVSTLQAQVASEEATALSAKVGRCVEIAPQRQADHARAAFTFNTILRDLKVRQRSLNSGAANLREVTKVYSEHVAADGRDLKLESGSLTTVLRWEKRADVVCMLLEGRQLRQALLDEPRTRMHVYIDLSPDCRAVEQCGMGFEYAIVYYVSPDGDAPPPFAEGRLTGEPLSASATVQFGVDGCPITVEKWKRIFGPMLAALGPKYASTCDCFMRMLQLYGSTVGELLDPDFRFATVERHDVAVPLIEHIENFTADAGGEVNKSGGVIDTVAPDASYTHCGAHGGNLALKRSVGFDRVGASVRSLSSFCRGGNKHTMLVQDMKCIQQPELYTGNDERLRTIYRDAHEDVKRRGLFHTDLGGCEAAPIEALGAQAQRLDDLVLVAQSQLDRKAKKGTEVRWKYEFEVLHDRLIDVAHLLAPAILIAYGSPRTGRPRTFAELAIDEGTEKTPKNVLAAKAYATLRDPTFLFWACHLRLLYTRVYKGLFAAVQANHHHAAPELAGADGLPMQWAAAMRKGVAPPRRPSDKPHLCPTVSAPLVKVLEVFPELGGANGQHAADAIADLEAQAQHLESYFAKWRSLGGLVHALAHELVVQMPLTEAACELVEGRRCEAAAAAGAPVDAEAPDEPLIDELVVEWRLQRQVEATVTHDEPKLDLGYFDLLPRVPSPKALAAAAEGLRRFEEASPAERDELPGALPWLLFSPTTRDGKDNPIFKDVQAFAAADVNPHLPLCAATGHAYPYRCWPELTKVLVAGGAKLCPSTSAQLESLFNGLTRQQGASKNNISQAQISFEARCRKNETMDTLTAAVLRDNWEDARAVQGMLHDKGFWVCDLGLAADRKLSQKLKEEREIELAATADADGADDKEERWEVERITSHSCKKGDYTYIVKWKGWESKHNTEEPEAHLLTCSVLLAYWKGKIKGKKPAKPQAAHVERVTRLQEAALRERHEAATRRSSRPLQREPVRPVPASAASSGSASGSSRPTGVPDGCRSVYDRAHTALGSAECLVFDTETSGFTGSVLNLGWILADSNGKPLVTYERLWRLPDGERIHRKAFAAHGISEAQLRRDGVPARPELAEFLALVAAAEVCGVSLVAHNALFDVRVLNLTAIRQGLTPWLRSASMLCTMHSATRHCGLRKRGGKQAKAPTNAELFLFLFGNRPVVQLHRALPDCHVTLASYIAGRKRKWW
jgi:DNA polymerase III epsilon subunit-like protein